MRMGDTLYRFRVKPEDYKDNSYLRKYLPAIEKVCAVTEVPASNWEVYEDGNQISTREAGKSSCAFLAANFSTLEQAVAVMTCMQRDLPDVNLELFVAPDGRQDQGDGVGSYDRGARDRNNGAFIQNEGFGVSILIDLQNVDRHLKAGQSFRKVSTPPAPSM